MNRSRLAAIALPFLLLVPAAPVAAQTPPDCTLTGISVFDEPPAGCEDTLAPVAPDEAAVLKAAQARWDAIAKEIGVSLTRLWLGPRPDGVGDLWWYTPGL